MNWKRLKPLPEKIKKSIDRIKIKCYNRVIKRKEKTSMFALTYDPGMYDDETVLEEFDTVEELLERYEEIRYDVCEIEAWKGDEKFAPWYEKN